jgi:hypothetical protein
VIRFTRDLLLGLTLMATGYALTRIGRWMQQMPVKPRQPGGSRPVPPRPVMYDSMFTDMPEFAEWLGPKHDPERWN